MSNHNNVLHIAGIDYESIVDGEGMRATIFLSGCPHNCPGCHNPEAQSPTFGVPATGSLAEEIAAEIAKRPYLSGITLSGGDPFYNPDATSLFLSFLLIELYDVLKVPEKNIWIYTGMNFEELLDMYYYDYDIYILLELCDVLVDGPFVQSLADKTLRFRGSSNQRIIDIKKSLKEDKVVLYDMED